MTPIIFLSLWFIPMIITLVIRGVWWFFFAEKDVNFCFKEINGPELILLLVLWPFLFMCGMFIAVIQTFELTGELIIKLRNLRFKE